MEFAKIYDILLFLSSPDIVSYVIIRIDLKFVNIYTSSVFIFFSSVLKNVHDYLIAYGNI